MKVYAASSWRNPHQPDVVRQLRDEGHDVYDFRLEENGLPGGFQWREIDPGWQAWPPEKFRLMLGHEAAQYGFNRDMSALNACDVCVLVLPCNRSAHLELGIALGAKKGAIVYYPRGIAQQEPELMYAACTIAVTTTELTDAVAAYQRCGFRANNDGEFCAVRRFEHGHMSRFHRFDERGVA